MREVPQITSSIDVAPTLLGLAGYHQEQVQKIMDTVAGGKAPKAFAGADLSALIQGRDTGPVIGPDGKARPGAFFMTNDMITEPAANPPEPMPAEYNLFLEYVRRAIDKGAPLVTGPVRQPNNVRALCTGEWKIVRYLDPRGVELDEWELYSLKTDPIERINLVDFRTGTVRDDISVPGMTREELVLKNAELKMQLAAQEALLNR